MARAKKTSFNLVFVPTTAYGSRYMHHKIEHRNQLNYVVHERTILNESWHLEYQANGHPKTLKNYLTAGKKIVKEKTKRSMQKKAENNFIGEGVVVIDDQTTMDDLKKLGQELEKEFGWTCVQIHIHRDEGYVKSKSGKLNLHAHMFFELTNRDTGKSWKMKSGDGSKMQDITAKALNLTRGESKTITGKDHLDAITYKVVQKEKELLNLQLEESMVKHKTECEEKRLDAIKEEQTELIKKGETAEAMISLYDIIKPQAEKAGKTIVKAKEALKDLDSAAERKKSIEADIVALNAQEAQIRQNIKDLNSEENDLIADKSRELKEIEEKVDQAKEINAVLKGIQEKVFEEIAKAIEEKKEAAIKEVKISCKNEVASIEREPMPLPPPRDLVEEMEIIKETNQEVMDSLDIISDARSMGLEKETIKDLILEKAIVIKKGTPLTNEMKTDSDIILQVKKFQKSKFLIVWDSVRHTIQRIGEYLKELWERTRNNRVDEVKSIAEKYQQEQNQAVNERLNQYQVKKKSISLTNNKKKGWGVGR
ncbi:hypothetical protein [Porphyromonas levii]|uniref:hypothetical protein n=1 Tax=Porphyromonas levii TaxID=28114 RepID=UPI001BAC3F75|nr:hypothetical protein [Porphyromonas levii]MBR8803574.1 hypothetical protein [Porphyromonas levii]